MEITGKIFDIKEFTVHDGPGARITVFLKGCPLRCMWCHNPEGLSIENQILYRGNLCTHCGKCQQKCSHEECKDYGRCIYACANGCLSVSGESVTSSALAEKLLKNTDFFKITGGGVTISGGEPLMQHEFVSDLADKLDEIHKALQTSGYADENIYKNVIDKFDYIMQDIKLVDDDMHRRYTGKSNKLILKNIEYLKRADKEFVFRVPLIPDITDTEVNLRQISEIAGNHKVELLKYNVFAAAKYKMVDREYMLPEKVNSNKDFTKYFTNAIIV